MIGISVKHEFERAAKALDAVRMQQLPYATARALTDAAVAGRDRITAEIPSIFDRPTDFTKRAAGMRSATKLHPLQSEVFIKTTQAEYLLHEEIGGTRVPSENTRRPDATALVLPAGIKLDSHGNIPVGALKRLSQQASDKSGVKAKRRKAAASVKARDQGIFYLKGHGIGDRGPGGFFQRGAGGHVTRLTGFEAATHYHPIFGFRRRVELAVRQTFAAALVRRLREALASAR